MYHQLLEQEAQFKVCDLGFVRLLNGNEQCESFDAGNVQLADPQKIMGQGYTAKTDVWALGQIFFLLLQGEYMFNSNPNQTKTYDLDQ